MSYDGFRKRYLKPVLIAVISIATFFILYQKLHDVRYHDIREQLKITPVGSIVMASIASLIGYYILTFYDVLALKYIKKNLEYGKTVLVSFISFVFSNNIGILAFGGLAFRYRFYSQWRIPTLDVARITVFSMTSFWLGLFMVGGVCFTAFPPETAIFGSHSLVILRVLGSFFLALVIGYLFLCKFLKRSFFWDQAEFKLPKLKLAFFQIVISSLDWLTASVVVYTLLPDAFHGSFSHILSVYMLANIAGLLSNVPAGLGVLEAVFILSLGGDISTNSALLGALLMYRVVYYLAPLLIAAILLAINELSRMAGVFLKIYEVFGLGATHVMPRLLSILMFISGTILMFSGSVPDVIERRHWLKEFLPLIFVEWSHLLSSLTGFAMLLVARGLQRRLDGAYFFAIIFLIAGIAFSLIKGFDYEEAIILGVFLLAFLPSRGYFRRKATFISQPVTVYWFLATIIVIGASVWLMFFSYKHVEYSHDLWWTFAFHSNVSRSLRAAVLVSGLSIILVLYLWLRPTRPGFESVEGIKKKEKFDLIQPILDHCPNTYCNLAFLSDKKILFNNEKTSFIMYAISGRSFVAMGEPIGKSEELSDMIWQFREYCDVYSGWPAFYQIDSSSLSQYAEAGFTFMKLGEEAVVPLQGFSIEGSHFKGFRHTLNRAEKEGVSFEIVPQDLVHLHMPKLKEISDAWLNQKNTREKRFSLGWFDEDYLNRNPVAVVKKNGVIVAFANIWQTAQKQEISVDLMRYIPSSVSGLMDYLFLNLILWGKDQGYETFNLGMAPFAGMENHHLAPLMQKLGSLAYRYGEDFYNFQGIREYKEKFKPEWHTKFLATLGGVQLSFVLASIAVLVSGGVRGVFSK